MIIVFIVIAVNREAKKIENNPYGFLENPMIDVYREKPTLDFYKMGDTNQKFKAFWDSKMFGSPIYNSINLP